MQVTNQDIQSMSECISDMFGGVTVSIDRQHAYYVFAGREPEHKSNWRVCVHAPKIILKEFASWAEVRAWAHAHDKDFSEPVIIEEE